MTSSSTIRIATRGSTLALWQARHVAERLGKEGLTCELQVIKTKGDRVQDRFLHEIGGKGLFVRELEEAMIRSEADLGVHSLKDLPAVLPDGFCLPAILKRHSPRDVMIFSPAAWEKVGPGGDLMPADLQTMAGMTIGTASLRRQSLLKAHLPGCRPVPVRGNVDTRIRRLQEGEMDALILARAALERLGIEDDLHIRNLHTDWFVPSPAQGALALECRADHPLRETFRRLNDDITERCATLERRVLERLGGDCTMPIGCFISGAAGRWTARAEVLNYTGNSAGATLTDEGSPLPGGTDPETLATKIITTLKQNGLDPILRDIAETEPDPGNL